MHASCKVTGISCGIFSPEIRELEHRGQIRFPIIYLDSILHMKPRKLGEILTSAVENELALGRSVLLLYGDCQPHMFELQRQKNVTRLKGSNCIEILMGRERYSQLQQDKSFVLLREWVWRWEEVFTQGLGFNSQTAQMFMPEHHAELLYVDYDAEKIPYSLLNGCAEFCGLPWRYERVSLDPLYQSIQTALAQIGGTA